MIGLGFGLPQRPHAVGLQTQKELGTACCTRPCLVPRARRPTSRAVLRASAEAHAWPADHGHKQQSHAQEQQPSLKDRFIQWWLIESPNHGKEKDTGEGKTKLSHLVSRILSLMQPDGWLILGACVFMVCAALAELTVPHYATKCIFTAAKEGANVASYSGYLKLLSGIIIVYGITSALRGYCFSIINNRMTMRLRSQLFHSLVMREVAFFDNTEVGTLTSRLQSDTQAMTKCIATNLNIAARNMLQAIGEVAT
ncbi:ABC transporter type 1, transmembrane domain-containing protein [Dunaliella salina]|uniref:ABC transporter type 1, transmembrane domain-containing protein n=1 Tax=Dunaliella salina TaxID=3046 RepID=A0ABQ7GL66_DUNSA|nr:ABC transporter type 1, transmembrane domain-containing protein [Dunaliella salina]|eukprot:KAF5835364.1 ABC transporter type 1, transmembrane domain-containing protein [Dunaliella salina]